MEILIWIECKDRILIGDRGGVRIGGRAGDAEPGLLDRDGLTESNNDVIGLLCCTAIGRSCAGNCWSKICT